MDIRLIEQKHLLWFFRSREDQDLYSKGKKFRFPA